MPETTYTSLIYGWIENTSFDDRELLERLKTERGENNSLYEKIKEEIVKEGSRVNNPNPQRAYIILIAAVSEYLISCLAPYSGKKRLSEKMKALCEHIGNQYSIPSYKECLEDYLVLPVEDDLALEIIKELHVRDGVTKTDLREKYKVSERTIQDYIHRISGDNRQKPVRIGGQVVRVPVKQVKNRRDDPASYLTENTMSPVVLQLNITQSYILIKALQLSFDSGNIIPLDLGIEIWSQLSDYTRKRIQTVFGCKDGGLHDFLEWLESEKNNYTRRFKTESEMFQNDDLAPGEQLLLALKEGGRYNLILTNPRRCLVNQRVVYDSQSSSYNAYSENEPDSRIGFSEDDLIEITKA